MKYKLSIFFIVGFVIYLIDITLNSYDETEIYISDQEIISLVTAWKSQVGRNPNDDEIARIINNLVEEEILYREALLLGLDKEDRIIKRRLAQKISFLKQETLPKAPSIEELTKYFKTNKEKYYIDSKYTFTHYFFSAENDSYKRSINSYDDITNGVNVNSDPFLLGKNFIDVSSREIDNDFGSNFSLYFKDIEIDKWHGPYKSAFGHHIIFVTQIVEGYYPELSTVLQRVEVDFMLNQRDIQLENYLNEIRSKYKIYINPDLKI